MTQGDTLEILARGVILVGFDGLTLDASLPRFGGYLLFSRNVASLQQMRELTDELRARLGDDMPPIVAIDQEGGRVTRIRSGVEPMPSMMALGAAGDLELTGRAGEQVAFDLRRAGCTMNLAPVVDLALAPANTVIGRRSLGSDPDAVASLGAAFGGAMERAGIIPCYKHFPGQGASAVDSHLALPVVSDAAAALRARDLVPFAAVAAQAPAIMSAHVVAEAFDAREPATLSRVLSTTLLRSELGFGGALVTDCLQMGALAARGDVISNGISALAAGADLLAISHDVDVAIQLGAAIARAVNDGTLPRDRLEDAYAHVVRLRRSSSPPLPLHEFPPHPGVGREIARRGVTLVRGFGHADPLTTIIVSFDGAVASGVEQDVPAEASLRRESPALAELSLPLDPDDAQTEAARKRVAESGRRPLLLARRAHLHASQAAAIDRILSDEPDSLVVSMLEPFDLPLFAKARHVLAAYGDDPASIGGLADVLFGGTLPSGRLPVRVLA